MKLTIEEVESRLEQSLEKSDALQPLVPKGCRVQVTLLDQNERKKRRSASADTWSPESDLFQISCEKESEDASGKSAPVGNALQESRVEASPFRQPICDLQSRTPFGPYQVSGSRRVQARLHFRCAEVVSRCRPSWQCPRLGAI